MIILLPVAAAGEGRRVNVGLRAILVLGFLGSQDDAGFLARLDAKCLRIQK